LEGEVKALVAVVQTTTERDRSSEAGPEVYADLEASMPWINFCFYDEHSIDDCYRQVRDGLFSSLVFASNSLFNPLIYAATEKAGLVIQRQSDRGMGIVILQQYLPPGSDPRTCTFLPIKHQVTFRAIPRTDMKSLDVSKHTFRVMDRTSFSGLLGDFVVRAPTLWSLAEPELPGEWSRIAWAKTSAGGPEITVIQRSRSPRARVIVSAIPLDWLMDTDLLANLVARSVMFTGTLYVHPPGRARDDSVSLRLALGRASREGRHLKYYEIGSPSDIDVAGYPYRHFNHLLLHPDWTWSDISGELRDALKRRLENEGSVTACADQSVVPGVPMLVTVGTRPAYLQLADRFASWLASTNGELVDYPAPPIRALAALAAAINSACEHNDAVPRAFDLGALRKHLEPFFERRLRDGSDNVDDEAMPTAAVASTMILLDMPPERYRPLTEWLERREHTASYASLRQGEVWLEDLSLTGPSSKRRESDTLFDEIIKFRDAAGPSTLEWLTKKLENPKTLVSHRAIIAEAMTATERSDAIAAVALSARTLHDDLNHAYSQPHPALELLAMLSASLIRIHKAAGIGVDLTDLLLDDGEASNDAGSLEEQLRREREERARLSALHQDQLAAFEETNDRVTGFSKIMVGTTLGMLSLLLVGVVVTVFRVVDPGFVDGFGIVGSCIAFLIGSVLTVGKLATPYDSEPAFVAWFRQLRD
jgi:hypothetical protein